MVDMHTHLLPRTDDGSRSIQESLKEFERLEMIGFDGFVLSPHFYPSEESMQGFVSRRDRQFEQCKKELPSDTYLGCELYLQKFLFNYEDISPLCISGTKYVLTEVSTDPGNKKSVVELLKRMIYTYNRITPVLAHIDRYPHIVKDKALVKELVEMGCRIQVNIDGFYDFFARNRLLKYVEKGYIQFMGSDSHGFLHRQQKTQKSVAFLEKALGNDWKKYFADII